MPDVLILVGSESDKPRIEPAFAHVVEHRELAAEMRRMVKWGNYRAGDETDALGARRDRGEEHAGIRRMPAVVVERVLDRLDARIPELVGARRNAQALVVIIRGVAVLGPERGEEIDAEFHRFIVSAVRFRAAKRA